MWPLKHPKRDKAGRKLAKLEQLRHRQHKTEAQHLEQRSLAALSALSSPISLYGPTAPSGPVLLSSPHSGRHYPSSFIQLTGLRKPTLRQNEDCFVDRLIAPLIRDGFQQIIANFPRIYVDVNRSATEWPPELAGYGRRANALLPLSISPRARAGMGVIPTRIGACELYPQGLSGEIIQNRLNAFYHPYHKALSEQMRQTKARFGRVLLLDMHSMPAQTAEGRNRADIILGTRYGESARGRTIALVQDAFVKRGYSVVLDQPYAGGYITAHYGQPDKGREVVQIEINKALYMADKYLAPHQGFIPLQENLAAIIRDIRAVFLSPEASLPEASLPEDSLPEAAQ